MMNGKMTEDEHTTASQSRKDDDDLKDISFNVKDAAATAEISKAKLHISPTKWTIACRRWFGRRVPPRVLFPSPSVNLRHRSTRDGLETYAGTHRLSDAM